MAKRQTEDMPLYQTMTVYFTDVNIPHQHSQS